MSNEVALRLRLQGVKPGVAFADIPKTALGITRSISEGQLTVISGEIAVGTTIASQDGTVVAVITSINGSVIDYVPFSISSTFDISSVQTMDIAEGVDELNPSNNKILTEKAIVDFVTKKLS